MRRLPRCYISVFILTCVLLTGTSADAQIAAEFAGGGALAAADNYGDFDHVFVPTMSLVNGAASVATSPSTFRGLCEEPGRIKSGPVVYIWTRSDRKTSFLVRGEARSAETQAEHRQHREALSEHQADLLSHSHGETLGTPVEARPITVQVLHRPDWQGKPYRVGDLFRVHKQSGGEQIEATCVLQTHPLGWELLLEIAGSLHRSQVCRSQDEALDTSEQWKAEMIETGWSA